MKPTDLLLDTDFDVMCQGGDIPVGDATYQHQAVLLKALPGSFKQAPVAGVGVDIYILDESPLVLLREIRMQFTRDGMQMKRLSFDTSGNLLIDANY